MRQPIRASPLAPHRAGRLAASSLAATLWAGFGVAAPAPPAPLPEIDATGRFNVTVPSAPDFYYRLLRRPGLGVSAVPVSLAYGPPEGGLLALRDPSPVFDTAFYVVEAVLRAQALDSDGDGANDNAELSDPARYNPLNPATTLFAEDGAVALPDRATFEAMARRESVPGAQGAREVKFLIMDADGATPAVYFMNTNNHPLHYYFARDVLGYSSSLGVFNAETYFSDTTRKNLAGSLVAHDNYLDPGGRQGIYTLEFWPTDPVGARFVDVAYQLVVAAMPFVDSRVVYHPNGETHRALFAAEKAAYDEAFVHTIRTEDLFANVSFSALNPGTGFGRLVAATPGQPFTARDVVIFDTVPNDLSHVAGIITEIPQTPLSHINLKAKQNGTPNAYVRDASSQPEVAALLESNVRFEVTPDGFTLAPASQAEVDAFFESKRPAEPQVPERDLSVTTAADLDDIGFFDAGAYGSKAANVAELRRFLPAAMVPDGFALPFSFYHAFMEHNGFYQAAAAAMAEPQFRDDPVYRDRSLAELREAITDGTAPPWLMNAVLAVQAKFPAGTRIRCRSSTNNEDLEGFNGAGLYESKTHRPSEGHLIETAKQVWASLWTFRAWDEREFYRIDHFQVAMGVLCHPSYRDEHANGVAVTKNIIDPDWSLPGFYVNVQAGESLVTNPDPAAVPEEFLIAQLLGNTLRYEVQYARFSNLVPAGTTVLTYSQAEHLADQLVKVQNHFRPLYDAPPNSGFAMEVEFKFLSDGTLAVKQARPWID